MPSNWTKQPQQLTTKFFNSGTGDSTIGGTMTGVPAGIGASMGDQTLPGDRLILGSADALALSDSTVGTLYGGIYMYVRTPSGSTATPTRGRLVFWDTTVADSQYQATPDESGTTGAALIAGVCINTLTKGNAWWILIAGKGVGRFRGTLSGTATVGQGVYAAAAGAGADVGTFDVFTGAAFPTTYAALDNLQNRYMGVAEVLPVAATVTLIDIPLHRVYRL